MPVKQCKPTTPGRRFMSVQVSEHTPNAPFKPLTKGHSFKAGRDNAGRISVRRKGGRHKRKYRVIDFKRTHTNTSAKVVSLQYDPNRSARIALLQYQNGERSYIIAPKALKCGDILRSGGHNDDSSRPAIGSALLLKEIPLGVTVHNIEIRAGEGAKIARSAGTGATLMAKEGGYATIKLPSGEVRLISLGCKATIGTVGNEEHANVVLGKAGRARYLGRRPKVRGVAMNPVDHPHGGGEGRTSGGRHPVSPTGVPTKGYRTRKKRKHSNSYIVRRRNNG